MNVATDVIGCGPKGRLVSDRLCEFHELKILVSVLRHA